METCGTLDVAKKSAKRNPDQWNIKPIVLTMRGTPEYKEWLEGLAEFDATSVAEAVERAMAAYAREIGYNKPRPKR